MQMNLDSVLKVYNMYDSFKNNRILVVDDEEFCLSSVKAILGSLGFDVEYQVEFCIHGKEAYEQLISTYANGMSYKFILTDFNMPEMDGIESTKAIRNHLTHVLKIPRGE
jgi:two-component system, sensor histidine kinase and response regulator